MTQLLDADEPIHAEMEQKSTKELIRLLEEEDDDEWTETAIKIARETLTKRLGHVPRIEKHNPYCTPSHLCKVNWVSFSQRLNQDIKSVKLPKRYLLLIITSGFFVFLTQFVYVKTIDDLLQASVYGYGYMAIVLGLFFIDFATYKQQKRYVAVVRIVEKVYPTKEPAEAAVRVKFRSAYLLTNGKIKATTYWTGFELLRTDKQVLKRIEEGDLVDLIVLQNGRILGLLEDFL